MTAPTRILPLWFCLMLAALSTRADLATDPRFQKQRTLLGYPPVEVMRRPRADSPDLFRWNLRMVQIDCSDVTTAQHAEEIAERLAQAGYTMVLIGSYSNIYVFRDPGDEPYVVKNPPFPEIIRNAKLLTDALHKRGVKVVLHTTCSMVTKQFIERHPSWASIDQTDGKPIFTSSKTYATCVANPEFQDAFLARLDELMAKTGADSAMVDETSWWSVTGCVCDYCRKAFKKETGLDLPKPGEGTAFFNGAYPSYQAFSAWRRQRKMEFDQRVSSLIWKHGGAQGFRPTYHSNPLWNLIAWIGMDNTDWLLAADIMGYEAEPPGMLYLFHWPLLIAEMKLMQAMARHTPGAPWTLYYYRLKGDPTWCWLIALSQGSRVWWRDLPEETALRNWEMNHEALFVGARPHANVGLLFSPWTSNLNPLYQGDWMYGFSGLCDAFTEQSFPYRVVIERDLLQANGPGVDVLFAPNIANLSMEHAEGLIRFVQQGGVLISSGDVSRFDAASVQRSDFLLSAVLGVSWQGRIESTQNELVIAKPNELTGDLVGTWRHDQPFQSVKPLAGAKVIGEMKTADGKTYPGLVIHPFGKGVSVYFAGRPELGNYFTSYIRNLIEPGKPWKDDRDPQWQKLLAACARFRNASAPFEVENAAPGIVVEAHRQESAELNGVQIHVANFLGGNLKAGTVPVRYDITFPEPPKPIRLKVRARDTRQVYLISPDFDEIVRVPFRRDGEWVRVELKELARYAILYFSEGNDEAIRRFGKLVSKPPRAKQLVYEESEPFPGRFDPKAVYLFSDLNQMKGGRDDIAMYKGLPLPQTAYGARTKFSTITANFHLSTLPDSPTLELGGCDDNAPTKAPLEIRINEQLVFRGASPFPDDAWGKAQWPIPAGILCAGDNTITIQNTGDSNIDSMPPWFMIHFIKIAPR